MSGVIIALVFSGIVMVLFPLGFQWLRVDGGPGEATQPVQKLMLHRLGDPMPCGHGYVRRDGDFHLSLKPVAQIPRSLAKTAVSIAPWLCPSHEEPGLRQSSISSM